MVDLRARASFFLIEQIIAVTVFAFCAAVCAGVFAEAFYIASDARDMSCALAAAKNGAEAFKALGSPEEAAAAIGGRVGSTGASAVYYDNNWRTCEESSAEAAYVMRLTGVPGAKSPLLCELSVERMDGEGIIAFIVAAKGGNNGG